MTIIYCCGYEKQQCWPKRLLSRDVTPEELSLEPVKGNKHTVASYMKLALAYDGEWSRRRQITGCNLLLKHMLRYALLQKR